MLEFFKSHPSFPCDNEEDLKSFRTFEHIIEKHHLSEVVQDDILKMMAQFSCNKLPCNSANLKKIRKSFSSLVCFQPLYVLSIVSMLAFKFGKTLMYTLMFYLAKLRILSILNFDLV